MKVRPFFFVAVGSLLLIPLAIEPARSSEETGRALAVQWCSSCHLVEDSQTSASDLAPSFEAIADEPDTSRESLQAWLVDPHPPMPDFNLGGQEVENIVAYLLSLKKD